MRGKTYFFGSLLTTGKDRPMSVEARAIFGKINGDGETRFRSKNKIGASRQELADPSVRPGRFFIFHALLTLVSSFLFSLVYENDI